MERDAHAQNVRVQQTISGSNKSGSSWCTSWRAIERFAARSAGTRGGKGNPLKKYNLEFQGDKGTSGGDPLDVDDIGVIGVGSEYSRSCSTAIITSSFFGEG